MKKFLFITSLITSATISFSQCGGFAMNTSSNNPTCYGFCDGSLTVNTTGGTGTVDYVITDTLGTQVNVGGSNTANLLCEGWYYITATDDVPCVLEDSIFIDAPEQMIADITTDSSNCFNDSTGFIHVDSVHNTTGDYAQVSYFLNPNPSGNGGIGATQFDNLPPGTYALTVNDANGCSITVDNIVVGSPPELIFTEIGFDPCNTGNDAVLYMAGGGGTPDYNYNWTNLQDTTFQLNATTWGGQGPGCYEARITDAAGCVLKDTICTSCLNVDEASFSLEVYPNPVANELYVSTNTNGGLVQLISLDGSVVFANLVQSKQFQIDLSDLPSGVYMLLLTNDKGTARKKVIKK